MNDMIKAGPFFFVRKKLIFHALPLTECRTQADKLDDPYGHDKLWSDNFKSGDYIDHPRGRVVWDRTNNRAIIYIDRCIDKPEVIDKIKEAFGITEYVTGYDDHYRCRRCAGDLFGED